MNSMQPVQCGDESAKCMTNDSTPTAFRTVQLLGYAGLLPQALALILLLRGEELGWIALAGGFAYAALIFSFLGGVWWGQAIARPDSARWIYGAAVAPSLVGLALFMPWTFGWSWPEPSLLWLGLFIMASPLADRAIGTANAEWMRLRWHLSLGLGAMTVALGTTGLALKP